MFSDACLSERSSSPCCQTFATHFTVRLQATKQQNGYEPLLILSYQESTRGRTFGVRHRKKQHMIINNYVKIARTSALVLFALFVSRPVSGANWKVVASPNAGTQANSLSGADAVADNDVWAVGWAWNNRLFAYRTLIEHWNGASWSVVRSPNTTTGYNLLNGVAVVAANDIWTVGQAANGNTYKTLVEHWNGTNWSIVPSPNVPGFSNVLQAISVVSANDIWAVGYSTDSNFNNFTLTLHWDGTNWNIVPSPSVIGDNILFGVAGLSTNDVWAVGNAGSLATLAIHWDGSSWSIVPTPELIYPKNNGVLIGIVALSSTNIWTAGQVLQGSIQQTLSEHWNGSSWSFVSSPNNNNSNNRLHGITVTPNGTLWAVGTTGVFGQPERTLILRKNP